MNILDEYIRWISRHQAIKQMKFYKLEGDQEGQGRFEEKGAEELLLWGHNSAIHFQIFQLIPGVISNGPSQANSKEKNVKKGDAKRDVAEPRLASIAILQNPTCLHFVLMKSSSQCETTWNLRRRTKATKAAKATKATKATKETKATSERRPK